MKTSSHKIMLGNLVAAAFERAASVTSDPGVAARLATYTVSRWLVRTQRFDLMSLLDDQIARSSRTAFKTARRDSHQGLAA